MPSSDNSSTSNPTGMSFLTFLGHLTSVMEERSQYPDEIRDMLDWSREMGFDPQELYRQALITLSFRKKLRFPPYEAVAP